MRDGGRAGHGRDHHGGPADLATLGGRGRGGRGRALVRPWARGARPSTGCGALPTRCWQEPPLYPWVSERAALRCRAAVVHGGPAVVHAVPHSLRCASVHYPDRVNGVAPGCSGRGPDRRTGYSHENVGSRGADRCVAAPHADHRDKGPGGRGGNGGGGTFGRVRRRPALDPGRPAQRRPGHVGRLGSFRSIGKRNAWAAGGWPSFRLGRPGRCTRTGRSCHEGAGHRRRWGGTAFARIAARRNSFERW